MNKVQRLCYRLVTAIRVIMLAHEQSRTIEHPRHRRLVVSRR